MDKMPVVAVLMSTYNGEAYIDEQIRSIFSQKNVSVRMYVRDDGSTDGTVKIVKEYAKKYPIELISDGENVRPGESFMRLVYRYADEPGTDYFAFADQDDIWLPEKLSAAIKKIENGGNVGPVLYCSNQYIYRNGRNEGERFSGPQRVDLIFRMTRNTLCGCTFVFNKALAQMVKNAGKPPDPRLLRNRNHDAWLLLAAICCGKVIYDETPHILYRIHGGNTVGIKEISFLTRLDRLKRYFVKRDDANIRLLNAKELLRLFPQMDEGNKKILRLYTEYQDSWKNKIALAFDPEIRSNCGENPMMFTWKVFTNFV